jgi:acetylornithine/succinyldiaminopimelate/putrescine aminotransferase
LISVKTRGMVNAMRSRQVLKLLREFESRNITFVAPDGSWPVVWTRAKGSHVWDAEARKYLDLTAAFGVAAAGHANPAVICAGQAQMKRLVHAMGDVHPHPLKAQLARELSRITFERWTGTTAKTLFCNSGFEAVEAAVKTALLATGRERVIAFEGSYHGLGYGALTATHREYFRAPFRSQLADFVEFVPFPQKDGDLAALEQQIKGHIGAVLVEPVQGRGGIRVPPLKFLPTLRRICDLAGALLVVDEVFTGFGRTGKWFACEHSGTIPDLICLGKALTGGFPLSACVGKTEVMDAWPEATGEALHTSTFLGHPVGCAMALAHIDEIRARKLPSRSAELGSKVLRQLAGFNARGLGLMIGIELPSAEAALHVVKHMLRKRIILLPEGEHGNVISLTPPLTIAERDLARAVAMLAACIYGADAIAREKLA